MVHYRLGSVPAWQWDFNKKEEDNKLSSLSYQEVGTLCDWFDEGKKGGLTNSQSRDFSLWKVEAEGFGTVEAFKDKLKTEDALTKLVTGL